MFVTNHERSETGNRHCMVVHAYYPLGEIRVEREAKALIDSGFEVDVICLRRSGEPPQATEYNVRIFRLPVHRHKQSGVAVQLLEYLLFFVLACWRLFKLHLAQRYRTIQVHNLPDFLVFSALLPRLMGAKILLDIHDLMPEFYAARFDGNINTLPVKLVVLQEKASCWFADYVITVTESWRRTLVERGVPSSKVGVVMNLPDPRVFPVEGSGRAKRSAQNGLVHVFYHGNVTERYGLDILVKAFGRVNQQLPNTRLTIHGRGDYLPEVGRLIDELGLSETVTLSTRLIPLEDVVSLIKSADLAVVPYRNDVFTDGILPTKLMEYAALGIPAIASETSAIRAYFDEEMVHYFPPGDVGSLTKTIIQVIDSEERLNGLSKNIQRFNLNYNWRQQAKAYVRLVEKLAGKS
jgi:glycosyltransferase involved in cell wall biosynthesis